MSSSTLDARRRPRQRQQRDHHPAPRHLDLRCCGEIRDLAPLAGLTALDLTSSNAAPTLRQKWTGRDAVAQAIAGF